MKVLSIELYDKGLSEAVSRLLGSQNQSRENRLVSATGAHGMVFSKRNPDFKEILHRFYLNLPDGMPGVWVGRLKGANEMRRCYGPEFFEKVMTSGSKEVTHFLCGGKEGVAEKLKGVCEEKFGASIVGTFCPPFLNVDQYDYEFIASEINKTNPYIVWIGLSTPKQEVFAFNLSRYSDVNFICCVGAAFDFHIGNVRQAPSWIQKIGMEWFFRLIIEPKRLWKRYIEIVPMFVIYNCLEFFSGNFFSKSQ